MQVFQHAQSRDKRRNYAKQASMQICFISINSYSLKHSIFLHTILGFRDIHSLQVGINCLASPPPGGPHRVLLQPLTIQSSPRCIRRIDLGGEQNLALTHSLPTRPPMLLLKESQGNWYICISEVRLAQENLSDCFMLLALFTDLEKLQHTLGSSCPPL